MGKLVLELGLSLGKVLGLVMGLGLRLVRIKVGFRVKIWRIGLGLVLALYK